MKKRDLDPSKQPRLFFQVPLEAEKTYPLPITHAHYLEKVLRLKNGDSFRLFNGVDGEWQATFKIEGKNRKRIFFAQIKGKLREQTKKSTLTLCYSITKKTSFDFILTKATELGVQIIQPIITERTQARDLNDERCQAIITEAAEQCERLDLPELKDPIDLSDTFAMLETQGNIVFCAESGTATPVNAALTALPPERRQLATTIITGPEGGFTEAETIALATLKNALPVRLGPRILKAETAAIAALTCWQAICGDWDNENSPLRS